MLNSVRARLTAWYVGALALVLVAFSAGGYLLLARSLNDRLNARLESTLQEAIGALNTPGAAPPGRTLQNLRLRDQTIAVLDSAGHVIAARTGPGGPPLRLPPSPLPSSSNLVFYELPESQPDGDDSCRGAFQSIAGAGEASGVVVLQSLEPVSDQLDLLLTFLYVVVPFSLGLAGLGGWFIARKSLAPVVEMIGRVQGISAENMEQRVKVVNPRDEIGRLAATFNELLARLSSSFNQQRQFVADASHELRTPISVIRTTSSVMLQRDERAEREYREALAVIEQEARRLTRIVEDLFLLARADAGHRVLQPSKFYLDELVAETGRAANVLAAQKKLAFEATSAGEAPFWGDEALLRQMMWNLLDNAIKHTPEGGCVKMALDSANSEYSIVVTDTGEGIPVEDQPNIFDRFYRADGARSRDGAAGNGGAGLGLPIARWIAEAHRGRLELQRSDPSGSTFVVFLPRA